MFCILETMLWLDEKTKAHNLGGKSPEFYCLVSSSYVSQFRCNIQNVNAAMRFHENDGISFDRKQRITIERLPESYQLVRLPDERTKLHLNITLTCSDQNV